MRIIRNILAFLLVFLVVAGALLWWLTRGVPAELSVDDVSGIEPVLAEPDPQWFPTVGIAKPIGWGEDGAPTAAEGLAVNRFAEGLEHPRVIYTMPGGDVLVTLSNAPPGQLSGGWLTNLVAGYLFSEAGAGVASPNQLLLLRDGDGDGVAEQRHVLRDDLDSPSGISWHDGDLYVANHDEILRFDYTEGATSIAGEGERLAGLPAAGNHWMRNLILNPEGTLLYVAVGSASNIAEGGMAAETNRAAIHEIDLATTATRVWASGLRNPNGLAWNPWSGELWTTVNERDQLGSDLVPDYLTNVPLGANYGWPWVYYGDVIDERVEERMPQFFTEYTRTPEYALGPHVAALGLTFTQAGSRMGGAFARGAFVARHGSWNRVPAAGYDLVFVAFDERGNPLGKPVTVLESFLAGEGETHGRPTWVSWDQTGGLLLSDDTAGIIWRVINPAAEPAAAPVRNRGRRLPPRRELIGDPARAFEAPPSDTMPDAL